MDTIRVVLADDHNLFREGTRELLENDGDIEVVGEAADGQTVLAVVDREIPHVAVVDIEMPGLDGIEVTRRIRQQHPDVEVLALTVHDEAPFVFAVLEAGASGYLLKDVHSHELVEAVRALHQGECVLHPAIARQVLARVRSGDGADRDDGSALTEVERDVLLLAARGRNNREIASEMGVSLRTVQLRFSRILEAFGVRTHTEAVIRGLRDGLFTLEELG